jgi:hypothetical protein
MYLLSRFLIPAIAAIAVAVGLTTPVHAQSEADCAARADRASRDTGNVVGGAVVGAAGGAAVGAIVSRHSRRGARRGAAIGTVVGGTAGAYQNNQTYKRVYDDCMYGRYR